MESSIERLIKKIREEKVAVFIGSGFSLKAGAPSVANIIDAIIKDASTTSLNSIPNKDRTLRKISQAFIDECNGRNELINILRSIFTFKPTDTSDQKMLYNIPHFKEIFTTNYDTLIEDAYLEEANVVTSNVGRAYDGDKPATIYKIHGDISDMNHPDLIVISEDDYSNFFKNNTHELICQKLKETFLTKYILFIGYSLEDDNILEMIKNIRSCIGDNMKGMFLVAPNFNKNKIEQLKKNRVTYIDAYAEQVLGLIRDELKKNVNTDYSRKLVSQETYELFCSRNGHLTTTTTHHAKENIIVGIQAEEGHKIKGKIQLTLPIEIKKKIDNRQYNDKIRIGETQLFIPAINIDPHSIGDFSITFNDIVFKNKDDISYLKYMPEVKEMETIFKMESIGFNETLNSYWYRDGNTMHIEAQAPICTIKIITEINDNQSHWEINFKPVKTYKDNTTAIKWINFLIEVFKGKELLLNDMALCSNSEIQQIVNELQIIKKYYKTIKCIEDKLQITFNEYDNYSIDNSIKTAFLYTYLYNEPQKVNMPQNKLYDAIKPAIKEKKDIYYVCKSNNEIKMTFSLPLGDMKLNGKPFNIPYKTIRLEGLIEKMDSDSRRTNIQEFLPMCMIWCTDKPNEKDLLFYETSSMSSSQNKDRKGFYKKFSHIISNFIKRLKHIKQ